MKKDPRTLEVAEPFKSLFPVDRDDLQLVTASIRDNGFDATKPILTWKNAFGEQGRIVVVDGHTRLQAALDLKLPEVWITVRQFKNVDEATTAGIAEQVNRRNMNREQIAANVIAKLPLLDETKDGLRTRTAKQLAAMLGVSVPTIDRARGVIASGDKDLIAKVKDGTLSLLAAYDITTGRASTGEHSPPQFRSAAEVIAEGTPPPFVPEPEPVPAPEPAQDDGERESDEATSSQGDETGDEFRNELREFARAFPGDDRDWANLIHRFLDRIEDGTDGLRDVAIGATVNANGHKGRFKIAQIQFGSSGAVYALNRAGTSIDLRDVTKVVDPTPEIKRMIEGP